MEFEDKDGDGSIPKDKQQDSGGTLGLGPAERVPVHPVRGERQAAEKLQGPSGLNEAGIATGHATTQRAHDHLADYQQRIMDDAQHQRAQRTAGTSVPTVRGP